MILKSIAGVLDATALRFPSKIALLSPFQKTTTTTTTTTTNGSEMTYQQLSHQTNALAGFLTAYGYEPSDVLISDLPNSTENLMLQLACNRLGVHFATASSLEAMATKFPKVKGAVTTVPGGFLTETNLPLPYLGGEFLLDLIHNGGLKEFEYESNDDGDHLDRTHAFYNSTTPFTNQQALQQGEEAAEELIIIDDDVVCISITLCHAFGMGSAVCSSLLRGATMVLPAVGGIQGCGVPSERAAATFQVLEEQKCTLLFADTHTLKALPSAPERLHLRGGVCKVGSGSTFLDETVKYGGVFLKTLGSRK